VTPLTEARADFESRPVRPVSLARVIKKLQAADDAVFALLKSDLPELAAAQARTLHLNIILIVTQLQELDGHKTALSYVTKDLAATIGAAERLTEVLRHPPKPASSIEIGDAQVE
jgi:hypothetical protein